MKTRKIIAAAIVILTLCLCACGKAQDKTSKGSDAGKSGSSATVTESVESDKTEAGKTEAGKTESGDSKTDKSEAGQSDTEQSSASSTDTDTSAILAGSSDSLPSDTSTPGKVYSEIVVTGIEDWNAVAYTIADFYDGEAFELYYVNEAGDTISGYYGPGTPDKLTFKFDTTGKVTSAVYTGTYSTPEDAEMGVKALTEHLDFFSGDITEVKANGSDIEVTFTPKCVRFDNNIITYLLEGNQNVAGYTFACENIFKNAGSTYTEFKGDNFACDVLQGIKVTWYE